MSVVAESPRSGYGTEAEVAAHIATPPATLRQWRWRGAGPDFVKVGKSVRYRWADVEEWLERQTVRQAAQDGQAAS